MTDTTKQIDRDAFERAAASVQINRFDLTLYGVPNPTRIYLCPETQGAYEIWLAARATPVSPAQPIDYLLGLDTGWNLGLRADHKGFEQAKNSASVGAQVAGEPIGYVSEGVIKHALSQGHGVSAYIQAGKATDEFPVPIYTAPVPAPATVPHEMVPLRMEFEPGYPEDVAFGSQMQMGRLKKWLDKYFAILATQAERQPQPAAQAAVPMTREQVAELMHGPMLTDIGYNALINGDTIDASLDTFIQFAGLLAALKGKKL